MRISNTYLVCLRQSLTDRGVDDTTLDVSCGLPSSADYWCSHSLCVYHQLKVRRLVPMTSLTHRLRLLSCSMPMHLIRSDQVQPWNSAMRSKGYTRKRIDILISRIDLPPNQMLYVSRQATNNHLVISRKIAEKERPADGWIVPPRGQSNSWTWLLELHMEMYLQLFEVALFWRSSFDQRRIPRLSLLFKKLTPWPFSNTLGCMVYTSRTVK